MLYFLDLSLAEKFNPFENYKRLFQISHLYSVLVLNKTWQAIWFHICDNWRSRGKTEVEGTRRLLDTVNAIKDTGELLLQMIEHHQKMLKMSMRLENLMSDAKMEIKMETISATRRKIGWGGGINLPPHLFLLKIGMWRQIIHSSIFLLDGL